MESADSKGKSKSDLSSSKKIEAGELNNLRIDDKKSIDDDIKDIYEKGRWIFWS